MLADLLVIALAVGFVVSFAERWVSHPLVRGGLALVCSVVAVIALDYTGARAVVLIFAAAFSALLMILVGERLATPPAMVIDPRGRRGL